MGFMLEIVTPHGIFFTGKVESVIVRGIEGELAVLKNRASIITPLAIGKMKVKKDGEEKIASIAGGYINVGKGKTIIVTDAAEWADEIDIERAEKAKARAEKRLREQSEGLDIIRAENALKRALNRLDVANYRKNK